MCLTGSNAAEAAAAKEIDRQLREDKKRIDREVKLLLLGAGESGKSTIAKQMKIIHKDGFSDEEKASYKAIIHSNTVAAMRTLVNACRELGVPIENEELADRLFPVTVTGAPPAIEYYSGSFTSQMAQDIKTLWKDSGIQEAFARQAEFQLIDSAGYYFKNIDRIASSSYVPTEQDVLRSRTKTTGIIEIEFDVDQTHFRMVDVGGQRNERKKWIHCFQDVTAIIFCVALSEYDLKLQEDEHTNRMHESLKLFREICNSNWFKDTAIILFLNKRDLFEEKIKRVDLKVCFPDYTGGKSYKNATTFIQERFLAQNENPQKVIYPHLTCATDTDNITVVFNAVKDIVVSRALRNVGIM